MPRMKTDPEMSKRERERHRDEYRRVTPKNLPVQRCSVPGCKTLTRATLCHKHRLNPDAPCDVATS